jgi:hypothetical protein
MFGGAGAVDSSPCVVSDRILVLLRSETPVAVGPYAVGLELTTCLDPSEGALLAQFLGWRSWVSMSIEWSKRNASSRRFNL